MKLRLLALVVLCFYNVMLSQTQWTQPIQITFGEGDDINPTFVNSIFYGDSRVEWLAFTRCTSQDKNICLLKTNPQNASWTDTVYQVTNSSVNDFASLASIFSGYKDSLYTPDIRKMLLWQHDEGNLSNIYYAYDSGNGFLYTIPLTHDSMNNQRPFVAPSDSGFGAVWMRDGKVAYSEFFHDQWSPLEFVDIIHDTGNFSPQLRYLNYFASGSQSNPMVIWEATRQDDTTHTILYSIKTDSGWTIPDTVAWSGDNRNPKFFKLDFNSHASISWESNKSGKWNIVSSDAYYYGDSLHWDFVQKALTESQNVDNRDASFMVFPFIIISKNSLSPMYLPPRFDAGTWQVSSSNTSDSIFVISGGYVGLSDTLSTGGNNRNPEISDGVPDPQYNGIRVWVVWESNFTGQWKLYGSSTDIFQGDVKEDHSKPDKFILFQNYPNPFNPTTVIRYQLPVQSKVTLRIYNLLGQEVRTLVNQIQEVGFKSVELNANTLSSGVYFYRLEAVSVDNPSRMFREVKKVVVIK